VLGHLAEVVAADGDPDRAESLIAQITNPDRRAELLIQLAETVTTIGDPDWEARLESETEALITQITNPDSRAKTLRQLTEAAAACNDLDRAEALIAQITNPGGGWSRWVSSQRR
jgi:hypothetical protein